jgi:hypothetical protein
MMYEYICIIYWVGALVCSVICFVSCVICFEPSCCVSFLMTFGGARGFVGGYLGAFLRILCKLGMCVIAANTVERCCLFVPPRWGVGPMALMLWLDWIIDCML